MRDIFYRKGPYIAFTKGNNVIVYNTSKEFEGGHSHIRSRNYAYTLIKNVHKRRIPKTRNVYILDSHRRLSKDESYVQQITNIIGEMGEKKYATNKKG